MKLRKYVIISLLLFCMLFFVGCSFSQDGDGNEDGDNNDQASISIWHNFSGEDLRAGVVQQIIEDFEEEYPDVVVDAQAIPVDGYRERISTAAAAKELPDVFLGYPGSFTDEYYEGDLIQPITPIFEENPEWEEGFLDEALDIFEYDDELYSAPVAISATSFLFYNKELFEENDIEFPTTWTELMEAIDAFNELDITPISLGNKEPWVAQSTTFGAIADRVTGTEWFMDAVEQDGATFTDEEFITALEYFQDLVENDAYQEGANGIDDTQAQQYFAQGNAAMIVDGSWTISGLAGTVSEDVLEKIGVAVFPEIEDGDGSGNTITGGPGGGFLLNSKTEGADKEAALDLIYALSDEDAQKAIAESESLVMYDVDIQKDEVSPLFYDTFNLLKDAEFAPVYDIYLSSEAAEEVNNGLQDIMLGSDLESVAENIQKAQEK